MLYAKKKAIFLDRDGTLNVDKGYLHEIAKFEFLPGAMGALKELSKMGYLLFIVTNQSGIGRGYYTEEEYMRLNKWMLGNLQEKGVSIENVYYCPHYIHSFHERYRKECGCRKPGTNLFWKAINEYGIDTEKSWAIGDKKRDLCICEKTKIKGILLYQNSFLNEKKGIYEIEGGLGDAVKVISCS